jgi:hypothetical protein
LKIEELIGHGKVDDLRKEARELAAIFFSARKAFSKQ